MRFRNVKVPEGINVSKHNPLLDLVLLTGALLLAIAAATFVLVWVGGSLARHVPMSWENRLADQFIEAPATDNEDDAVTPVLQDLADRLLTQASDEDEVRVTVHYLDRDTVNAFATLGGNVYITRGLIERLDSKNALAMVMAHEIAHVAHRDAIAGLGSGVLLQIVFSLVLGHSSEDLTALLLGSGGVAAKSYSRDAERAADAAALRAVMMTYGHVAGADDLFVALQQALEEANAGDPPAFLSTHPLTEDRIAAIRARATAAGWPLTGPLTALPSPLATLADEEE